MTRDKHDCTVLIPTHKSFMSKEEEKSFSNTLSVLSDWDIVLLLPHDISASQFEDWRKENGYQFSIINGKDGWMGSIKNYNDMALDPEFYLMFSKYKYLLICHLDAWVFRDELEYWTSLDYDYIGAPWFVMREEGEFVPLQKLLCSQGGNGGLCLRRIDKMIELRTQLNRQFNFKLLFKGIYYLVRNKKFKFLKIFIYISFCTYHDLESCRKKYNIYEDALFSIFYALLDKTFRVAPADEAIYFASEVYSEEILNSQLKWKLPFGIHGYDKFMPKYPVDMFSKKEERNSYSLKRVTGDVQKPKVNTSPLVTIITATYNLIESGRVETFKQCIESVLSQDYSNIEHIIIDGASTDGTLNLIQEYVDSGACVCYSKEDNGIWDAMYKGQNKAKGVYVNILNSDDYFTRDDAVSIAVKSLIENNAVWYFSEGTILNEDGSVFPFPTNAQGVFSCMGILHQTMFVDTQVLRAIDPFRTSHITRENYLMLVLLINNFKYAYSNMSTVCYRTGGFSTNEYGNENRLATKQDFGAYFYDLIGRFWCMSEEECQLMFGWDCFSERGFKYSFKLYRKLGSPELKKDFRRRLMSLGKDRLSVRKKLFINAIWTRLSKQQ